MVRLNTIRPRHASKLLAASLIAFACAGCCCPSVWYDMQAQQTWNELQVSINEGPPPELQQKAGFTMKLPLIFPNEGANAVVGLFPGGVVDGVPVPQDRRKPYLVANNAADIVELPALKATYEAVHGSESLPVYCYVCSFPSGPPAYAKAKDEVLAALKTSFPNAAWQQKTIEDQAVDYLELTGSQGFSRKAPLQAQMLDGTLLVYAVEKPEANVVIAFRAPTKLAGSLNLIASAEASIPTINTSAQATGTSTNGGAESGTGSYVLAPNTQVELIPPAGFKPTAAINGFSSESTNAKIIVQTHATPYSATAGTYDEARLRNDGITLVSSEEVQQDGGPARLVLAQKGNNETWVLVFGDESKSFSVVGELHDDKTPKTKAAVKAALLTARVKK